MNDKSDETAGPAPGAEAAAGDNGTAAAGPAADDVAVTEAQPADGQPAADAADNEGRPESGREDRSRGGRGRASALFLFCLILAGAGAGGYFIYDINAGRKADQGQRQALAERLDGLQQGHGLLADTLGQLEQRQRDSERQTRELLQRLNMLRRQTSGEPGWKLAEVAYLLQVASRRLALARDVDTAQAVLHSADALLREIPDPALIPVRARLRGDLNRLRAYPRPDFSGAALSLGELAGRVTELPLKTGRQLPARPPRPERLGEQGRWQELAGNVWQELKALVVITREGGDSVALLAPTERFFLYRNLRLQLDAARLALLARDQVQYATSLGTATDWLREFFDVDDAGVRSALEILQAAAALNLDELPPSVEPSLNAFDEYLLGAGSYRHTDGTR